MADETPEVPAGEPGDGEAGGEAKEIEALKIFREQCYLIENIKDVAAKHADAQYSQVIKVGGPVGNAVSQINHGVGNQANAAAKAILELCPDIYALLTPYVKISRVVYGDGDPAEILPGAAGEQEIPFRAYTDRGDISSMTNGTFGRLPGAGLKSFSWGLEGMQPGDVDNNITAKLVLHFQSLYDLFRYNMKDGKAQAGIEGQAGYLDLIIGAGTSLKVKGTDTTKSPDQKSGTSGGACVGTDGDKYDGVRFRIKAVAGWSTPPNFTSLHIPGYTNKQLKDMERALEKSRTTLFLQIESHAINFLEDGSVELSIDYRAALSGIMTAPNADIFGPKSENAAAIKAVNNALRGDVTAEGKAALEKHADQLGLSEGQIEKLTDPKTSVKKKNKMKTKLLDSVKESEEGDRLEKHERFLNGLYESGKIYRINLDKGDLRTDTWDSLSTAGRVRRAIETDEGFDPEKEKDVESDDASYEAAGDERAAGKANDKNEKRAAKNKVKSISYFYLGDLLDNILSQLTDVDFEFMLTDVEVVDPLVYFRSVRTAEGDCPGDPSVIKGLEGVDPFRFKKDLGITTQINIGQIPISLKVFQQWFLNNVIKKNRDHYFLLQFIKDICAGLITRAYSSECFGKSMQFRLTFNTVPFDLSRTGGGPGKKTNVDAVAKRKFAAQGGALLAKDIVPASVLYCVDSKPNAMPDDEAKIKKGVYPYYFGASCGLLKTIKFSKYDAPHLRVARVARKGVLGAEQLREMYQVDMDMVGNTLHKNGNLIYFDPINIGGTESQNVARTLGLAGYFRVTKVNHTISETGFDTQLAAYQEGIAFDDQSLGKVTKFEGDADSAVQELLDLQAPPPPAPDAPDTAR